MWSVITWTLVNLTRIDSEDLKWELQEEYKIDLDQLIAFEADMILGDAINPYTFDEVECSVISEFKILSVYPNPFNPVTNISYYLNESADVEIIIYDLAGRKVQTLDNSFKESGEYTVSWDASNHSSGIYYIQISNGEMLKTQKMTLIK